MRLPHRRKWLLLQVPTSIANTEILKNRQGAFNFAQRSLPLLLQARESSEYPPTLIFTGATASVKGSANFASFASAKFALRALAQSLAREFGPQGVHVSHTIIDGVIDIPRTKAWTFEHEDAKLSPDAVSDRYKPFDNSHSHSYRLRTRIGICIHNRGLHLPLSWISDPMLRSGKDTVVQKYNLVQLVQIIFHYCSHTVGSLKVHIMDKYQV
jgi:NAD(P)-dependent dehydrogenase (short-subunit alcohol dehydrogenase family)